MSRFVSVTIYTVTESLFANRGKSTTRNHKRQKSNPQTGSGREASGDPDSRRAEREILRLVRSGVERFILKNATVEDFFVIMKAVEEKEKIYSHQLTKSVLSGIVKEAIRKRNLTLSK